MNFQKKREAFELSFKSTQIYCRECAIRGKDILEFSKTMNGYFNIVTNDAWNMWLDAKAQVVREWIDLNERMPEQGQKVLIFRPNAHEKPHEDPNFKIATYCGNDIWINSHFEHEITHWMPLTNPLESNP